MLPRTNTNSVFMRHLSIACKEENIDFEKIVKRERPPILQGGDS